MYKASVLRKRTWSVTLSSLFLPSSSPTDPVKVPTFLQILNSSLTTPEALASFRNIWVGAAPLAAELQARFKAFLTPSTTFTQVWGMTETSCIATMLHYPEQDDTGSVGRMLPCMDAKLVDDEGNDITGYDVAGELCVRGPIVVRGYYNNPAANQHAWDAEGFFHTGDIAMRKRENGLWYIVDRKKELIKVRGFQVAPAELESVLLAHPAVGDAAVIGVAGTGAQLGNELPRAYVVTKEGCVLNEVGIQTHVRERLAGYKQLVGGVRFLDSIPRNASGKILKGVLKNLAEKEVDAQL
jgi:4-coumarate--CoA ligase